MVLPLLLLGIVATVIAAASSRRKQANQSWASAAGELGITLKPTGGLGGLFGRLSMTGSVRGLEITIDTHQSNDNTFTRYRVRYPSLGLGLTAKRQHALARIGTFLGFQDIEIGDPVFDAAIILKGDYPERIGSFLTPARRIAISGLIENYPGTVITDTEIAYSKRGIVTSATELLSTMQRIMAVAQELRGLDRYSEKAADRRLAGEVTEALEILERAPASGDPFIDFARQQQVGEIRYARGDASGARQVFDELERQAPDDPEITRWARYLPKELHGPKDPHPPKEKPDGRPVAGSIGPAGDATAVAGHLFHKNNYTFETMEIFETEYEGKTVRWWGELKRLRRFDHDRDFGDGPAVKAVFTIAVLESDLYGGRRVDAIVHLPAAAESQLALGHRVSFSGTLWRCDPAMRNLYVANASLLEHSS